MYIILILAIFIGISITMKLEIFIYYIINFIIGILSIILLCKTDFPIDDHMVNSGLLLVYLAYIFSYFLLFFSSLSYLLFNQKNRRTVYFIISGIVYFLIIIFVGLMLDASSNKGIFHLGIRLFISFFPLHLLMYFKLKKINKI